MLPGRPPSEVWGTRRGLAAGARLSRPKWFNFAPAGRRPPPECSEGPALGPRGARRRLAYHPLTASSVGILERQTVRPQPPVSPDQLKQVKHWGCQCTIAAASPAAAAAATAAASPSPYPYTGLGRGPYGGRHLGSCPPFWPQFQARGWTSTTFAHCKLTYFIFIIAYDCFRNPSSTKLNIFLHFCLHNELLIFS